MIIVNYWQDKDYDSENDGYDLKLAGVINDCLDLNFDVDLIIDCIDNQQKYKFKDETLYVIYLERALIDAPHPHIDPAFAISQVVEMKRNVHTGEWETPPINL